MVFRSICFAYLGSMLAGLAIGVGGTILGLTPHAIVTASAPTGVIVGLMGLSIPWAAPKLARLRNR